LQCLDREVIFQERAALAERPRSAQIYGAFLGKPGNLTSKDPEIAEVMAERLYLDRRFILLTRDPREREAAAEHTPVRHQAERVARA
jgi:hypothetical protein